MTDMELFIEVLMLLGRGVGTSPRQLSELTGCSLYRSRKIFREMHNRLWIYRRGNQYVFATESELTWAVCDAIRAWDK
jgi:hypothetical protein